MKAFLLVIFIYFIYGCSKQDVRTISLPELGWSFDLPRSINFKDSSFDHKGYFLPSSWESSYNSERRMRVFNIEANPTNYFNTILYIDSSSQATWDKEILAESRFYVNGILKLPGYRVRDTAFSIEVINGTPFQKEYFKYYRPRQIDTTYSFKYSRKYKNYSMFVNIRYNDKKRGRSFLKYSNPPGLKINWSFYPLSTYLSP